MSGLLSLNVSSIPTLREICIPAAVARFIVTIVVNALNSKAIWAYSHISQKIIKRQPSFAHCNSTAAVVLKAGIVWVCRSLNELRPCFVRTRVTEPVLVVFRAGSFLMKAATRLCQSMSHAIACGYYCVTAIAQKQPACVSLIFKCSKPSESFAFDVDDYAHGRVV